MKLTRRQLAAAFVSAGVASGQQPPPAPGPAPDDDLRTARERVQANARTLSGVAIPMATEPAFQFKA